MTSIQQGTTRVPALKRVIILLVPCSNDISQCAVFSGLHARRANPANFTTRQKTASRSSPCNPPPSSFLMRFTNRNFPNCAHGKDCLYIHPTLPCKYGSGCVRPNCAFTHPPPLLATTLLLPAQLKSAQRKPCRNGFACTVENCKYAHPSVCTSLSAKVFV